MVLTLIAIALVGLLTGLLGFGLFIYTKLERKRPLAILREEGYGPLVKPVKFKNGEVTVRPVSGGDPCPVHVPTGYVQAGYFKGPRQVVEIDTGSMVAIKPQIVKMEPYPDEENIVGRGEQWMLQPITGQRARAILDYKLGQQLDKGSATGPWAWLEPHVPLLSVIAILMLLAILWQVYG